MFSLGRAYPASTRARAEAYGGLILLLLGVAVLSISRCPRGGGSLNHRRSGRPALMGGGRVPPSVDTGNAYLDGNGTKGWFVGHFMPQGSAQHAMGVETKWAVNPAGRTNGGGFATNAVATSMAVLISGMQRIEFEGFDVLLENQGDYVIWGPGVKHSWTAFENTVIMCIRWPSHPGDQTAVGDEADAVTAIRAGQAVEPEVVEKSAVSGANLSLVHKPIS